MKHAASAMNQRQAARQTTPPAAPRHAPDPARGKHPTPAVEPQRLQKVMAAAGLGARRKLDDWIAAGEVQVNGRPAVPGMRVASGDRIRLFARDYRVVSAPAAARTLVYNKPAGVVTTRTDPQSRPTVFDRLPPAGAGRWIAVGRLDINTSGLLLLTTDGELANAMMHPSGGVDREYVCRVHGDVRPEHLEQLKQGVMLDDGPARVSDIQPGAGDGQNRWFYLVLLEGRNREVRRLWAALGFTVSRLKRVRYGAVHLGRLRAGEYRELSPADHRVLREDVGLSSLPVELTLIGGGPSVRHEKTIGQNQKSCPERLKRTRP